MIRAVALVVACCAVAFIGCSSTTSVSGTVMGVVSCEPSSPTGGGMVPGANLDVYFSASGQTIHSVRTDAVGRFLANLAPAVYRVGLGQPTGIGLAITSTNGTDVKGRNWNVPIHGGQVITLNLICDTGIL